MQGSVEKHPGSPDSSHETRSLKAALAGYLVVFFIKLAGYGLTGVMVLLAEALHTLSDILISGFLLAAAFISRELNGVRAGNQQYI